jgi:hypothetical protein
MFMSKKELVTYILVFINVLVIVVGAGLLNIQPWAGDLSADDSGQYVQEQNEMTELRNRLSRLSFVNGLMNQTAYNRLRDISIELLPDPFVGRFNPFAQIGDDDPSFVPSSSLEIAGLPTAPATVVESEPIEEEASIEPIESADTEPATEPDNLDTLIDDLGGTDTAADVPAGEAGVVQ